MLLTYISPVPGPKSRRNFRVDGSNLLNTVNGCLGNVKNLGIPYRMVTAPSNCPFLKIVDFLRKNAENRGFKNRKS